MHVIGVGEIAHTHAPWRSTAWADRAVDAVGRALRPAAMIGAAAGMLSTYADVDLWGHLRFGFDILASGHVATGVDPYSFTQSRPFLYHEWLGGVIMAAAYKLGGVTGLSLLKALLALAIVGLVWHTLRHTRFTWRWAGTAVAAWGTLPLVLTLRPQLWTGLLLVITCRVLLTRSRRAVWALPPLFALWANLHGGWIVGGALVAVWTAGAFLERHANRWHLLSAGVVSLAATLLNPYGITLWTFLLETVRLGREEIIEWEPVWRAGTPFMLLWGATTATALVTLWRRGRPPIAVLVSLSGLACAAARVNRMGPLFVLATVTLLSRQWPREQTAPDPDGRTRLLIDTGAAAFALVAALWIHAIPPCISYHYADTVDTTAGESLRGTHGRLVTHFNWGEYAIWHFGPALKVSIDARRETLYSEATLREQLAMWRGEPAGLSAFARLRPEYVWLPADAQATSAWLLQHGYREDVRTGRSFIAVRDDLPPLRAWQGAPSQCFPGP